MENHRFGRGKYSHYNWPAMINYLISGNLGSVDTVAKTIGSKPEDVDLWLLGVSTPTDPYIRAKLIKLCEK